MECLDNHVRCWVCFRVIGGGRGVKGSSTLKYSTRSVAQALHDLTHQELILSDRLCFRCYRLVLGMDQHNHLLQQQRKTFFSIYHQSHPSHSPKNNANVITSNTRSVPEITKTSISVVSDPPHPPIRKGNINTTTPIRNTNMSTDKSKRGIDSGITTRYINTPNVVPVSDFIHTPICGTNIDTSNTNRSDISFVPRITASSGNTSLSDVGINKLTFRDLIPQNQQEINTIGISKNSTINFNKEIISSTSHPGISHINATNMPCISHNKSDNMSSISHINITGLPGTSHTKSVTIPSISHIKTDNMASISHTPLSTLDYLENNGGNSAEEPGVASLAWALSRSHGWGFPTEPIPAICESSQAQPWIRNCLARLPKERQQQQIISLSAISKREKAKQNINTDIFESNYMSPVIDNLCASRSDYLNMSLNNNSSKAVLDSQGRSSHVPPNYLNSLDSTKTSELDSYRRTSEIGAVNYINSLVNTNKLTAASQDKTNDERLARNFQKSSEVVVFEVNNKTKSSNEIVTRNCQSLNSSNKEGVLRLDSKEGAIDVKVSSSSRKCNSNEIVRDYKNNNQNSNNSTGNVLGLDGQNSQERTNSEVVKLGVNNSKVVTEDSNEIVTVDCNNKDMKSNSCKIPVEIAEEKAVDKICKGREVDDNGREKIITKSRFNLNIVKEIKMQAKKWENLNYYGENCDDKEEYQNGAQQHLSGIAKRKRIAKKLHDFDYFTDDDEKGEDEDDNSEGNINRGTLQHYSGVIKRKKHTFVCIMCKNEFHTKRQFSKHPCHHKKQKKPGGRQSKMVYVCKGCQVTFPLRREYIKHIDICYKNIPVTCNICQVELPSAAYLPRHLNSFHKASANIIKNSLCDQCGRGFSRKESLERHKAMTHGVSYGTHQCPQCGRTFPHTAVLAEHLRAHKGYPCAECPNKRVFSCMSNLLLHRRTHHSNTIRSSAIRHTISHPFHCPPCNKRWKYHASYTYHMRKFHSDDENGDEVHRCGQCKMLLASHKALLKHTHICSASSPSTNTTIVRSGRKRSTLVFGEFEAEKLPLKNNSANTALMARTGNRRSQKRNIRRETDMERRVTKIEKLKGKDSGSTEIRISDIERKMLKSGKIGIKETALPQASEIVLETLDDVSGDCQFVILVEDCSANN